MGNDRFSQKPVDVGSRGFVSVLGRTLIIVVGIVSATCLLITIVIAALIASPMIAWYMIREGKRTSESARKPNKKEFVNLNIDEILGVKK